MEQIKFSKNSSGQIIRKKFKSKLIGTKYYSFLTDCFLKFTLFSGTASLASSIKFLGLFLPISLLASLITALCS